MTSPLIKSNPFCKNKVQGQTPYFSMWFPLRIICIKQVHLLYNIQNVVVHLIYHKGFNNDTDMLLGFSNGYVSILDVVQ